MASRMLVDLHPILRPKAVTFKAQAAIMGVDILIYCTWRSSAEQDELFKQGRSREGQIVTWVKGGASKHNFMLGDKPASLAFDCVPLIFNRPQWQICAASLKMWATLEKVADDVGLEWGGHFKNGRVDRPHFQISL